MAEFSGLIPGLILAAMVAAKTGLGNDLLAAAAVVGRFVIY